jgi:hypothetical protein
VLFAVLLLLLAAAALWWPGPAPDDGDGSLLVLAPAADLRREEVLEKLARYLSQASGRHLGLEIAGDRAAFTSGLDRALVVLCPDGAALPLAAASWHPLAAGRRRVPWNQRPAATLISRRDVPASDAPWLTAPRRTAVGDSLSLVCLAPLCDDAQVRDLPAGVAWGDDPYDHGALLVAARHGAFDHVLARQWDVEAALAAGRLDRDRWHARTVSEPVPDVVVLASRRLPMRARLSVQQALTVLGRREEPASAVTAKLTSGLGRLGLDGFNALLGHDFDRLRARYHACWPHPAP